MLFEPSQARASAVLNVQVDFAPFTVRVFAVGSNDSTVPLTVCVTCLLAFAFEAEEEADFTGWADVDFVVWAAAAPATPTARASSETLTAAMIFFIEDLRGRQPSSPSRGPPPAALAGEQPRAAGRRRWRA